MSKSPKAILMEHEAAKKGHTTAFEDFKSALKWQGSLIPAIIQDEKSLEVLMMAWMNEDALQRTLTSQDVYFWSRSRNKLWRKGEESGNTLTWSKVCTDCDADVLLIQVQCAGPACHTMRTSCFYNAIEGKQVVVTESTRED